MLRKHSLRTSYILSSNLLHTFVAQSLSCVVLYDTHNTEWLLPSIPQIIQYVLEISAPADLQPRLFSHSPGGRVNTSITVIVSSQNITAPSSSTLGSRGRRGESCRWAEFDLEPSQALEQGEALGDPGLRLAFWVKDADYAARRAVDFARRPLLARRRSHRVIGPCVCRGRRNTVTSMFVTCSRGSGGAWHGDDVTVVSSGRVVPRRAEPHAFCGQNLDPQPAHALGQRLTQLNSSRSRRQRFLVNPRSCPLPGRGQVL